MPAVHMVSSPLDEAARSRLVFAGDLLVFRDVGALTVLAASAEEIIRHVAGTADPTAAEPIGRVRDRFRRDPATRELLARALEEVGVDIERAFWDRFHLRISPPDARPAGSATGTIGLHRDTWASNVLAQTNWWAPLRSLTRERTLAFHLAGWVRPLANTSARWDLEEVRAQRRAGEEVALVPELTEPVDPAGELRIVVEPGDLLCFSGAHLHGSVTNTSDRARVSVEVRTVHLDDLLAGRRAPALDGSAPRTAWSWFRRVADGLALSEHPELHGRLTG
ncbi:MAG: hypothetical protein ACRDUY_08265 [Nitriliruptorales bacterium]